SSRSCGTAGSNRIAEGAELPSALLSACSRECVERIRQLDVDQARAADHRLPPRARQGAGDSTRPEIDVTKRLLRDTALKADVRYRHPASGLKHPKDLTVDAELVGAEIDHAIGDHDIRPPIFDGQIFNQPLANLDIVQV